MFYKLLSYYSQIPYLKRMYTIDIHHSNQTTLERKMEDVQIEYRYIPKWRLYAGIMLN